MLFLFVVRPLEQIANGLFVARESFFGLDCGKLGRAFFRSFLSGCFCWFYHKNLSLIDKDA